MKDKILNILKPLLTKQPSKVGYWELNEMLGSSECLRQKHQYLNFWVKTIWTNYGRRAQSKWERRVSNWWNHIRKIMVESRELWNLKPKLWTSLNLDFHKQLCYCTCLCEMFKVRGKCNKHLRGKCNKHWIAPLNPSIVFRIHLWSS